MRGIPDDVLERGVASITADRDLWVRIMLRDEYGLPEAVRSSCARLFQRFRPFLFADLSP